jgi:hypothetical protein
MMPSPSLPVRAGLNNGIDCFFDVMIAQDDVHLHFGKEVIRDDETRQC